LAKPTTSSNPAWPSAPMCTAQPRTLRGSAIGYIPRKKLVHFRGRHIRDAIPLLRKPRTIIVAVLLAMSIGGLGAAQAALCPGVGAAICKLSAGSYFTLAVTVVALLLMCNDAPPDLVLVGTTTLLLLTHVISDEEALRGFCSPSVLAIGALFPVARSLEEAQTVDRAIRPILGHPTSHRAALLRLCAPVAIFSGFLNNTPIVAMLISPCETWAANSDLYISVLLMPLSFSSMLGGMCTLIGTSTNLVLNSQIEQDPNAPLEPFGMFSMTPVSLPAAILGIGVMALLAPPLLSRLQITEEDDSSKDESSKAEIENPPLSPKKPFTRAPPSARLDGYFIDVELLPDCTHIGMALSDFTQLIGGGDGPGRTVEPLWLQRAERKDPGDGDISDSAVSSCNCRDRVSSSGSRKSATDGSFRRSLRSISGAAGECASLGGLRKAFTSRQSEDPAETSTTPSRPRAKSSGMRRTTGSKSFNDLATASEHADTEAKKERVRAEVKEEERAQAASPPAQPTTYRTICRHREREEFESLRLESGDRLCLTLYAETLPRLRAISGLLLGRHGTHKDKHVAESSCMVEACVCAGSPLVGLTVEEASQLPLLQQALVWGARFSDADARKHLRRLNEHPENDEVERSWHGGEAPRCEELPTSIKPLHRRSFSDPLGAAIPDTPPVPETPLTPSALHSKPGVHNAALDARRTILACRQPPIREFSSIFIDVDEVTRDDGAGVGFTYGERIVSNGHRRTSSGSYLRQTNSGTLALAAGDTLLLEVSTVFAEMYRHSGTFALLNEVHGSRKCAPSAVTVYGLKQRWVANLSLVVLLVLSSTELVPLLPLTLSLSFVLVGAGCITVEQAWNSISYRVLITIAASFGLGSALKNTHISNLLADALISLSGSVPNVVFLFVIFACTSCLSCIVSNSATVVLLYSVLRAVEVEGLSSFRMMLVMMIGASSAFATPLGYQTNLLVVGRGGYRFGDFTRLGGILTLVVGLCVSALAWGLPESLLP